MGGGSSDTSSSGTPSYTSRTTTYFKDKRIRAEQVMSVAGMNMNTVTITDCPKGELITLDPDQKIYYVSSLDPSTAYGPDLSKMKSGSSPMQQYRPNETPGTGTEDITYSVQMLDPEKVAGLDTTHYMLSIEMKETGCPGNSDNTIKMEIWTANIQTASYCPPGSAPSTPSSSAPSAPNPCKVTMSMHGDLTKLGSIFGNMPVREKIYLDKSGKFMEIDMREYSLAPLDDSVFQAPADFKQETQEQYQKDEQSAMMQHFTHGAGSPSTGGGNDTLPTTPSNTNNGGNTDNNGNGGNNNGGNANANGNNGGNANGNNNNGGDNSNTDTPPPKKSKHFGITLPF
jgi:hypothetical protein